MFLKGCALSCWWCHNPESQTRGAEAAVRETRCIRCGACVEACPHGAVSWDGRGPVTDRGACEACGTCVAGCVADAREVLGRTFSADEVLAEVERDQPFYEESGGGVTVSGGEPLLQREFTAALLRGARERGIHTALDTCGYAAWSAFETLRSDVDLFLYDVKLMDDTRHRAFTGVPNSVILGNLRALAERGHRIVLRVPVIPGLNDDEENLRVLGSFAAGLPGLLGVHLLPYHQSGVDKYARLERTYRLPEARSPSAGRLAEVAALLEGYGLTVSRGRGG